MNKRPKPTVDDYSRFLDEVMMTLQAKSMEADRGGEAFVAATLRVLHTSIAAKRSKRGL